MKPAAAQPRRQPPGAAGATVRAQNRAQTAPESTNGLKTTTEAPTAILEPSTRRVWRLWFAALLGPARPTVVNVCGQRVKVKRRRLELPPGPNGSRGNPMAHARWVKTWRKAGAAGAVAQRLPTLARVRISAVIHRRAIGTADEDNDRARLKPLVDGLRDAGVIRNDTRGYVEWGDVTEARADGSGPGILLIIEALPAPGTEGE